MKRKTAAGALVAAPLLCALLLLCALPRQTSGLALPRRAAVLRDAAAAPRSARVAPNAEPSNAEPSIEVAARQPLFDYAVRVGLGVLNATLRATTIPAVNATVEVPLLGGIDVSVRDVNFTALSVDPALTRVAIEAGFYHAAAANVTANITFGWAWSKGPLGGSGVGELTLDGGALDAVFLVRNAAGGDGGGGDGNSGGAGGGRKHAGSQQEQQQQQRRRAVGSGAPQVVFVSSGVAFAGLQLSVHAASADWLYQALLYVFSGAVRRQIEAAADNALRMAVPAAINDALGSLPSRAEVRGLPFDAVFSYAVYTLSYVVVKGHAEVAVETEGGQGPARGGGNSVSSGRASARSGGTAACPFPATPLPLAPAQVGGEPRMLSVYAHESVVNCVAWGLHRAGALRAALADGDVPGLRLTADLLGGLLPDLPAKWPKHGVVLAVESSAPPRVEFASAPVPPSAAAGAGAAADGAVGDGGGAADVSVALEFTTAVSVLNASADGTQPLQVATLAANLSFVADFGWNATALKSVAASYAVANASTPVKLDAWARTAEWAVRQATARLAMAALWDQYVRTPVAPWFALEDVVTGGAGDGWRSLSANVRLTAELPAGGGGSGDDDGPVPPT